MISHRARSFENVRPGQLTETEEAMALRLGRAEGYRRKRDHSWDRKWFQQLEQNNAELGRHPIDRGGVSSRFGRPGRIGDRDLAGSEGGRQEHAHVPAEARDNSTGGRGTPPANAEAARQYRDDSLPPRSPSQRRKVLQGAITPTSTTTTMTASRRRTDCVQEVKQPPIGRTPSPPPPPRPPSPLPPSVPMHLRDHLASPSPPPPPEPTQEHCSDGEDKEHRVMSLCAPPPPKLTLETMGLAEGVAARLVQSPTQVKRRIVVRAEERVRSPTKLQGSSISFHHQSAPSASAGYLTAQEEAASETATTAATSKSTLESFCHGHGPVTHGQLNKKYDEENDDLGNENAADEEWPATARHEDAHIHRAVPARIEEEHLTALQKGSEAGPLTMPMSKVNSASAANRGEEEDSGVVESQPRRSVAADTAAAQSRGESRWQQQHVVFDERFTQCAKNSGNNNNSLLEEESETLFMAQLELQRRKREIEEELEREKKHYAMLEQEYRRQQQQQQQQQLQQQQVQLQRQQQVLKEREEKQRLQRQRLQEQYDKQQKEKLRQQKEFEQRQQQREVEEQQELRELEQQQQRELKQQQQWELEQQQQRELKQQQQWELEQQQQQQLEQQQKQELEQQQQELRQQQQQELLRQQQQQELEKQNELEQQRQQKEVELRQQQQQQRELEQQQQQQQQQQQELALRQQQQQREQKQQQKELVLKQQQQQQQQRELEQKRKQQQQKELEQQNPKKPRQQKFESYQPPKIHEEKFVRDMAVLKPLSEMSTFSSPAHKFKPFTAAGKRQKNFSVSGMWNNVELGIVKHRSSFWSNQSDFDTLSQTEHHENRGRVIDPNHWTNISRNQESDNERASWKQKSVGQVDSNNNSGGKVIHKARSSGNLLLEEEAGADQLRVVSSAMGAWEERENGRKSADIFVPQSHCEDLEVVSNGPINGHLEEEQRKRPVELSTNGKVTQNVTHASGKASPQPNETAPWRRSSRAGSSSQLINETVSLPLSPALSLVSMAVTPASSVQDLSTFGKSTQRQCSGKHKKSQGTKIIEDIARRQQEFSHFQQQQQLAMETPKKSAQRLEQEKKMREQIQAQANTKNQLDPACQVNVPCLNNVAKKNEDIIYASKERSREIEEELCRQRKQEEERLMQIEEERQRQMQMQNQEENKIDWFKLEHIMAEKNRRIQEAMQSATNEECVNPEDVRRHLEEKNKEKELREARKQRRLKGEGSLQSLASESLQEEATKYIGSSGLENKAVPKPPPRNFESSVKVMKKVIDSPRIPSQQERWRAKMAAEEEQKKEKRQQAIERKEIQRKEEEKQKLKHVEDATKAQDKMSEEKTDPAVPPRIPPPPAAHSLREEPNLREPPMTPPPPPPPPEDALLLKPSYSSTPAVPPPPPARSHDAPTLSSQLNSVDAPIHPLTVNHQMKEQTDEEKRREILQFQASLEKQSHEEEERMINETESRLQRNRTSSTSSSSSTSSLKAQMSAEEESTLKQWEELKRRQDEEEEQRLREMEKEMHKDKKPQKMPPHKATTNNGSIVTAHKNNFKSALQDIRQRSTGDGFTVGRKPKSSTLDMTIVEEEAAELTLLQEQESRERRRLEEMEERKRQIEEEIEREKMCLNKLQEEKKRLARSGSKSAGNKIDVGSSLEVEGKESSTVGNDIHPAKASSDNVTPISTTVEEETSSAPPLKSLLKKSSFDDASSPPSSSSPLTLVTEGDVTEDESSSKKVHFSDVYQVKLMPQESVLSTSTSSDVGPNVCVSDL